MKRVLKIAGILLLVVLAAVLCYVGYVFGTYSRIEDNQELSVTHGSSGVQTAEPETDYKILSWNIGFGAYEEDFGFFMDGGTESRAWSKERLEKNLDAIGETAAAQDADLMLLQEVDFDSDRSYHVDEALKLRTFDGLDVSTDSVFAVNYHSAYLFYPITQPHGASNSGLLTTSKLGIRSAVRRSLPVETGVTKLLDLDRCYSVSKIPVSNGKALCLYNLHLSAYTSDGKIADEQLELLLCDMQAEYEAGNYVIGGGDFNKDLLEGGSEAYFGVSTEDYTWAQPLRFDLLEKTDIRLIAPQGKDGAVPTVRNADGPYHDGQLVLSVDGFLVSPNVEVTDSEVVSTGFAYSDHNPICMSVTLLAQEQHPGAAGFELRRGRFYFRPVEPKPPRSVSDSVSHSSNSMAGWTSKMRNWQMRSPFSSVVSRVA